MGAHCGWNQTWVFQKVGPPQGVEPENCVTLQILSGSLQRAGPVQITSKWLNRAMGPPAPVCGVTVTMSGSEVAPEALPVAMTMGIIQQGKERLKETRGRSLATHTPPGGATGRETIISKHDNNFIKLFDCWAAGLMIIISVSVKPWGGFSLHFALGRTLTCYT